MFWVDGSRVGFGRAVSLRSACLAVLAPGLLALSISAGLAGCGSGSSATPGPTPTPTPTPSPPPAVTSISPQSAAAGARAFTLTVNGSNFSSGSTVEWGGSSRTTTFVSSSQLQAHIMQADLATPGKVTVSVVNSGGGASSGLTFTIAADTIVFESFRALDGSDAANTNGDFNVWVVNPDGSGATPLTHLTAPSAQSSDPAWSTDGSKIAFDSNGALDGSNAASANKIDNIWIVNADGSGLAPLTRLTTVSSDVPAWSPDGSRIAFESARVVEGNDAASATGNIWVMNADGSAATPLTRLTAVNASSSNPVWSPDGKRIAFISTRALDGSDAPNANMTFNIWVMNADGSGATPLTKLTATGATSDSPAWSPDGSKIAFMSARALDLSNASNLNSTSNVWVVNVDGTGTTPLTRLTAATSFAPAWSPDGSKIAFDSFRALDGTDSSNTCENIWTVNADGTGVTLVTRQTAGGGENAAWSPDGSKIFSDSGRALDGTNAANTNGTFNIWVVNADGSGASPLTKITASGGDSFFPRQP